ALAMELCVLTIYIAYSMYFILYLRMDIAFAWTTESVYGIFTLILCYMYMKKGNWQKKKI
ncbi:MAG: MATE family efflux transporter, partial [Bacteroides acidifaciens]|nr:MATE family efflux transporter [Bacteroides acidifaciens]